MYPYYFLWILVRIFHFVKNCIRNFKPKNGFIYTDFRRNGVTITDLPNTMIVLVTLNTLLISTIQNKIVIFIVCFILALICQFIMF